VHIVYNELPAEGRAPTGHHDRETIARALSAGNEALSESIRRISTGLQMLSPRELLHRGRIDSHKGARICQS
jgi:hypothetical protein